MPSIVIVNVSQTQAPTPSKFQQTGAVVSQGGTTLAQGATALITQKSDLPSKLAAPLALASLAWSGGVVTATAAAAIAGRVAGDKFKTTITGATPAGYNGLVLATVTGANTFTYPLANAPGANTAPGTYTPAGVGELVAAITSFFNQGTNRSVYLLELGPNNGTSGPPALATWDAANDGTFYAYLVPQSWDGTAAFRALINAYLALSAKRYFFGTTTLANYSSYTNLMKCAFMEVEAPGTPLTEMSVAAAFQHFLSYRPSSSNRMTPMGFAFLFGVTPYPTVGNNATLQQLKDANINYVGTGAEGGISTAIQLWGKMLDGNDASYWYEVDWMQLEAARRISNAVINGSNNPLNPLYYEQFGINRLQDVSVGMLRDAVAFGIANGKVGRSAKDGPDFAEDLDNGVWVDANVCNAVPFITYVTENPGDFKDEVYGGLSIVAIPQRGFEQVIFNINVTDFVAQG